MREVRSRLIKEELMKHKPVINRSSGGSLYPRVNSGDKFTFHPVSDPSEVSEEDIVFCEVQPGNRFYAHMVCKKVWGYRPPEPYTGGEGEGWYFVISNLQKRGNGGCAWKQIYGKLTDVRR